MKLKITWLFCLATFVATAQYDLGLHVPGYEEGDLVVATEDDPLSIDVNIGLVSGDRINNGDTLYWGLKIEDTYYSFDLVEGEGTPKILGGGLDIGPILLLLTDEFYLSPGLFFEDTVDLCIVIFGIGEASLDFTFEDDSNPDNNSFCFRTAVNGTAVAELQESEELISNLFFFDQTLVVHSNEKFETVNLMVSNSLGQLVEQKIINLSKGQNFIQCEAYPPGIYFIKLEKSGLIESRKIIIRG